MVVDLKPSIPQKEDNLQYDLKNMYACDITPVTAANMEEMSRDNVQLLVNKLFALETEQTEDGVVAELPALESFHLPREKKLPKEKAKTRWQKFAEQKGITKQKRSRMVYCDITKDWVPRHGYKSVKHIEEKHNWVIPHKEGNEDSECPFEKRKLEKNLTIAKQKMREVRNKAEALGEKMPFGCFGDVTRVSKRGEKGLKESLKRAQTSSASAGVFDRKANNEEAVRGKKRKVFLKGDEKQATLNLMNKILKGDAIDKSKAGKMAIDSEQKANAQKNEARGPKKKKQRKN